MRATLLMIKRYLRKRPGQIVALTVLTALAGALVNLGYLLGVSYSSYLDERAAAVHAADAMYVVPAGEAGEHFQQALAADDRVTGVEVDEVLYGYATYRLNDEDVSTGVIVADRSASPELNRVRTTSELDEPVTDPVWAAQILSTSGAYDLGDEVTFTAGDQSVSFHIQGFTEELYTLSPQGGAISIAVPQASYAALAESGPFRPSLAVKVLADSPDAAVAALDDAVVATQESGLPGAGQYASEWGMHLALVKSGSILGANIFAVAFLAFSGVIVVVVLIVMRFLIKNLITADMTSIGAMRAVGFTTGGVIAQLATTFGAAALVASALGAGLSYLALPGLGSALASQTGLTWSPSFSPAATGLSIGLLTSAMLVFAIIAALRVRSVTTVAALRGGSATHSFRRNRLPLHSTAGPVNALLGLKAIPQHLSQNLVMALTIAAVTFASVFAVGMTTNLLANPKAFSQMVIGDVEDVGIIAAQGADAAELLTAARQVPGVTEAFYSTIHGTTIGGTSVALQIVDDYSVLRYDSTYEGRLPEHDNEVAIGGKLADANGLDVGDTWTIEMAGRSADFLITGLTSSSRGFGQSLAFTTAGYERLDPAFTQSAIAIYVADGTDPDQVIEALQAGHGSSIAVAANGQQNVDAQLSGYLSMIGVLATVVVLFTVLVVVLVVGLVVATMIAQSRRQMGVHKAVGFTSRDLTSQTMWSYLPVVAIGAVIGGVVGAIGLNPILGAMLAGIGVLKVELTVAALHVVALAAAVLVLAAAVTWLAARRIGRISAYQLVSE